MVRLILVLDAERCEAHPRRTDPVEKWSRMSVVSKKSCSAVVKGQGAGLDYGRGALDVMLNVSCNEGEASQHVVYMDCMWMLFHDQGPASVSMAELCHVCSIQEPRCVIAVPSGDRPTS